MDFYKEIQDIACIKNVEQNTFENLCLLSVKMIKEEIPFKSLNSISDETNLNITEVYHLMHEIYPYINICLLAQQMFNSHCKYIFESSGEKCHSR